MARSDRGRRRAAAGRREPRRPSPTRLRALLFRRPRRNPPPFLRPRRRRAANLLPDAIPLPPVRDVPLIDDTAPLPPVRPPEFAEPAPNFAAPERRISSSPAPDRRPPLPTNATFSKGSSASASRPVRSSPPGRRRRLSRLRFAPARRPVARPRRRRRLRPPSSPDAPRPATAGAASPGLFSAFSAQPKRGSARLRPADGDLRHLGAGGVPAGRNAARSPFRPRRRAGRPALRERARRRTDPAASLPTHLARELVPRGAGAPPHSGRRRRDLRPGGSACPSLYARPQRRLERLRLVQGLRSLFARLPGRPDHQARRRLQALTAGRGPDRTLNGRPGYRLGERSAISTQAAGAPPALRAL